MKPMIIYMTRKEEKTEESFSPQNKCFCPRSLCVFFFTFNTLISHVRTNSWWKWEKFSTGAAAKLSLEWHKLIELMVWTSKNPVKPFQEKKKKTPVGFFSVVHECAGATLALADRTPLRSPAAARMKRILGADTRWQELMWSSTSVTAFISYAVPLIPRLGDISDTLF